MRGQHRLGLGMAGLVVAGMLAGPALAQDEAVKGSDGNSYQRKTVINFEDDTIEGDLKTPDGEYLEARKKARHKSLIKIREQFRRRILQSARGL
jgi:hypothetical protein